jgi:hypothetical protein
MAEVISMFEQKAVKRVESDIGDFALKVTGHDPIRGFIDTYMERMVRPFGSDERRDTVEFKSVVAHYKDGHIVKVVFNMHDTELHKNGVHTIERQHFEVGPEAFIVTEHVKGRPKTFAKPLIKADGNTKNQFDSLNATFGALEAQLQNFLSVPTPS